MTDSPPPTESSAMASMWSVVKVPAVLTALGAALLSYFGWAFIAAEARTWGIDSSYLSVSRSDFLLRSVNTVQLPLGVGLVGALAMVVMWRRCAPWFGASPRRLRFLVVWLKRVGALLLLVGTAAFAMLGLDDSLLGGVCLAAGASLVIVGLRLEPSDGSTTLMWLTVLIAIIGTFSATRVYAGVLGERHAEDKVRHTYELADVVLYSDHPLWFLAVIGDRTVAVDRTTDPPLYRYRCLSLLQRVGDTLFLVPFGYSTDRRHTVIYAVDRQGVRLDFDDRRRQRRETEQRCP